MKKKHALIIAFVFVFLATSIGFAANESQTRLTPQDIQFLKKCNIDHADIDAIPNLNPDGQTNLQLVLESSRRNCDMQPIKAFKATREYLRKFTPPPQLSPMPPKLYNRIYLTEKESRYISDVNRRILDKALEDFGKKH